LGSLSLSARHGVEIHRPANSKPEGFQVADWFLAKSKSRKEELLIGTLARWGVQTFYPYVRRLNAGRSHLEPLFPTYVFCQFDQQSPAWQAIRWSPGLSYFVSTGDELATISDSLVGYLMEQTRRWNDEDHRVKFVHGDSVQIVRGPFRGLAAVFHGYMAAEERCRVLLDSVQGVSVIELPESSIGSADQNWRTRFGAQNA
jgi:transcriptional antiterminator RfaH